MLRRTDQGSQLVRGQYALALTQATDDSQGAAALLAAEQPLPHYLLDEMLRPHIGEFNAAELDAWRAAPQHQYPVLLINLALELLVGGKNDEAEQWAHALPGYETSIEAGALWPRRT